MNMQKFTQKSLEALQNAQQIAIQNQNSQVEQEHLMLALINDENGLIKELLEKMKISKELLKGSTKMLILEMVKDENMYGYQMIKKLKEKSNNVFEFKEGTLYPILHSLEEKGLISSYWDDTTGKKRKYYAITTEGKKSLKEKNEEWKIFSESVNRVIGGVSFAN